MLKKALIYVIMGVLIIITLISLTINNITLKKVENINRDISQLTNEIQSLRNNISSEVGRINNVIKEEGKWWNPAEMEIVDIDKNIATVNVRWKLKEYSKDSVVTFNYIPLGKTDYVEVLPKEHTEGYFSATIEAEIPLEPSINVYEYYQGDDRNSPSQIIREENIRRSKTIKYYISKKNKDQIITSNEEYLNIRRLVPEIFNPIQVNMNYENNNISMISIAEEVNNNIPNSKKKTMYEIEKIYIETRLDNKVQDKTMALLNEKKSDRRYYIVDREDISKKHDSMYIIIHYNNDLVVEERIY